jgi:putative transposase
MGRKRHLLVDTLGLRLKAVVTTGAVQDRVGAQFLAYALRWWGPELPRLDQVWADGGYRGTFVQWAAERMDWEVRIVPKLSAPGTFTVQPHRWIVERTFAWLGGFRRLSKEYEYQLESSEANLYAAMCHLMVRRLARGSPG